RILSTRPAGRGCGSVAPEKGGRFWGEIMRPNVDGLWRSETGHREFAAAHKFAGKVAGKGGRSNDRFAELGGDLLQPRGKVHRRADAGEIKPAAPAHISHPPFPPAAR